MKHTIYQDMQAARLAGIKKFSILIDPDKVTPESLLLTIDYAVKANADYIFFGGSLLVNDAFAECIDVIKSYCNIPVVIFPGSILQIDPKADAILYLSLLSGRNPELLIGQQVAAAPALRNSGLEIISTGYLLIDGGNATTVSYISNTLPIPHDKNDIAVCTAWAGEMLGFKLIYLDTGSGAMKTVSESMVTQVSSNISLPLIVGGGINTASKAAALCKSGADIIVVGSAFEKEPSLIISMAQAVHHVGINSRQ
jgi:phosphoglycerol geranylgeranyltransferase